MHLSKRITSFVLTVFMLTCFTTSINAENITESELNDYLLLTGITSEELDATPYEQKVLICNTLFFDESAQYVDSSLVSSEGIIKAENSGTNIVPLGAIPTSDLSLSVTCWLSNGRLLVYPTYEWKVPVKPRGKDFFGYSSSDSYSAVPRRRSNLAYIKDDFYTNGKWVADSSLDYTASALTGYQHQGGSLGTPDRAMYFKAHCFYELDIDSSNPVKKIVLSYVHDKSWGGSFSYGISYGPISISVTPYSSSVDYQNNVYYLSY